MAGLNQPELISFIIPVLNEAGRLPLILADISLYQSNSEVIIIDAGSSDKTSVIAELWNTRIFNNNEANRGSQMLNGSLKAKGEWLLFLHADSRLKGNWVAHVEEVLNSNSNKKYAWFFDFSVEKKGIAWEILKFAVYIRSHLFQRPYGDQGLLISRELYFSLGGYRAIPLMEDLDIVIRISKKTKLLGLGTNICTSLRKYKKRNILQNSIRNFLLRYKWKRGVKTNILCKEYYSEN